MIKPLTHYGVLGTGRTVVLSAFLLLVAFCGQAVAGAVPTIQLNGADNIDALSSQSTLTVTVELNAGDQQGVAADWWIVAETPMGWYYYEYPDMWYFSEDGMESLMPAYQGALFTIAEPLEVLRVTGLPSGDYVFYFGVDTIVNGQLDMGAISYDWAAVKVAETGSYPVVDTAQDTCYDDSVAISCPDPGEAFYGQDAQHTGNAPSYADSGDGTVTDNITGLMWQQSPDTNGDGVIDADDKLTYDQAVAGAGTLSLGGYTDWRLPTIKELYSLIDFRGVDPSGYEGTDTAGLVPFMDTAYFDFGYGDTSADERIIDAQYASLTKYVSTTMNGDETMFGVNFADGRIKGYGLTVFGSDKTFFVIYVRENTDYPYYWSNTTHANWSAMSGGNAAYVAFGRAMGYMNGEWMDVHGAGAQRSDPKAGDPADYPTGHGPQGDAIRIYNYVRLVRDISGS